MSTDIYKHQIRRGAKAELPQLSDGEFGYCTDTQELFIGNLNKNILINESKFAFFTITPFDNGLQAEFRLKPSFESIKFAYYAIAIDGIKLTKAVPINQPIRSSSMNTDFLDLNRVTVFFYDLRDIQEENSKDWLEYTDQSFESLLNLNHFNEQENALPSLELNLVKTIKMHDVQCGFLTKS